jgi:predicted DNA-binding WGR domain protein
MSDLAEAWSTPLQVLLERVDPSRNVARYYVLSIEPTLFARNTLVRRWGRIGSGGRERMQWFDDDAGAEVALEIWLARKRRRGYAVQS